MNIGEAQQIFCNPGSERALLALCLKDASYFYNIASKIAEFDFLQPNHPPLFSILKHLAARGIQKFDLTLIMNAAKDYEIIKNVGGLEYVQTIANMANSVSTSNFDKYLEDVVEASTKFKLYTKLDNNLNDLLNSAKDNKQSVDLIGSVQNDILELSMNSLAVNEPRNLADGLIEYIEERRKNPIKIMGISTGYNILNNQIDGLISGTLFIVAARKKMGKSTLLTNMASYIAYKEEKPCLYIDTELTFEEWRPRVIACMAGVKERIIKHGGYDKELYNRIVNKCVKIVEKGKLFHEYMPGYTVDKITALYKKYSMKHELGVGFFDYLKEPDSKSLDRNRKEYQVLGDVTTKLKDIAGVLNIPMVTAVQLNRQNDIADSDRIARYGDIIAEWALRSEKDTEEFPRGGSHKLVIRDTRRGGSTPEEGIGYWFFKEHLRIKEVLPYDQQIGYSDKNVVNKDSAIGIEKDLYEDEDLL